jgi:uncharacterized protein (TIGR04255 family)
MMFEDALYKKTFLKEVIARIDFATPVESFQKSISAKILEKIKAHFPIAEPADAIGMHLEIGAGVTNHKETRSKQWNFFGKERDRQLVITDGSVFVVYKRYVSYEAFIEAFADAVSVIDREHSGIFAQRIGLRYINQFEFDELSLKDAYKLFSNEVLGTLPFSSYCDELTRSFHVIELKYDDVDVRFQYGFPNPDYPAIIKRNAFVVDIDAYVQIAQNLTDSLKYVDAAHDHIQRLFESAITDELRGQMNA